jgi:ribonucleoside-diphosphate reductase beta chain
MEYREIINARRIAFGEPDRLMSMAAIKYKWAEDIYDAMENNTWFPKSIALGDDKTLYRSGGLSEREKNAYDKALAFLSNLDGIQFNNLITNIGLHITAPEVSLCIARQAAEEGVHVRSYQFLVEAVSLDPEAIYMMFQKDGMLAKKNAYIMLQSDVLRDDPTPANFARAVVGNILLEGVHFYAGFLVFYALAKAGKMIASADMIKYINRDEGGTHLELFAHIHDTFRAENPGLYDRQFYLDAERMFRDAVELEVAWGKYIIQGGFLALTDQVMEDRIKFLGNERWKLVAPHLPALYPGVKNPCAWVDDFAKVNGGRQNFFERKPTDYAVGGLDW